MANSIIWTSNPIFVSGSSTPFGFYDNDFQFVGDATKVANFIANRLGFPSVDLELGADQIFTCFEEAVSTYGNEIYMHQIKNNYISLEASSTGSLLNNQVIHPSLSSIIRISADYGAEVGVGGNVENYKGRIELIEGQQDYDLNTWASASASLLPGDGIEIRQVFYENIPAINRYFDPFAGTGYGTQQLIDSFEFGSSSPAVNFMMMPLNFDVAVLQAIELNDSIRKSTYSFSIINNKLKIFPIPTRSHPLYFTYVKNSEKNYTVYPSGSNGAGDNLITNISNVPFNTVTYSTVNAPGRFWIFEYALVLAREMLGLIRGKYSVIPIPGDNISLNQQDLFTISANDKTSLIEKLRADLEETSRRAQLKRKQEESDSLASTLTQFPLQIFIG